MALVAAMQLAPAADAVGPRTLKKLRQAPCPPDYRPGGIKAEYSSAEIDDALDDDRYDVAVGQRPVLTPPVDWTQDPIGSQTFRNALHALNWTQVLFAAHLERGPAQQELALEKATALFLDWIAANPRGDDTVPESAWGTKRAGDRLTLITYLARSRPAKQTLSALAGGAELLDAAADHALYIERHRSSNNHGLFDAYALAVAAENLPFMRQAKHWRKLGVQRFESVLRGRIVDDEGIWLDHSTTYAFAVVSLLERLLALPNTGDKSLRKLLGRMERAAAWLVEKPNGARLQWGDSGAGRRRRSSSTQPKTSTASKMMRRSGLAFVRDGDSYLAALCQLPQPRPQALGRAQLRPLRRRAPGHQRQRRLRARPRRLARLHDLGLRAFDPGGRRPALRAHRQRRLRERHERRRRRPERCGQELVRDPRREPAARAAGHHPSALAPLQAGRSPRRRRPRALGRTALLHPLLPPRAGHQPVGARRHRPQPQRLRVRGLADRPLARRRASST